LGNFWPVPTLRKRSNLYIEDDQHPGKPLISRTDDTVALVREKVRNDWLSQRSRYRCWHIDARHLILTDNLIRRKRLDAWKSKSRILHRDNAPTRSALPVRKFSASKITPVVPHPHHIHSIRLPANSFRFRD